MLIYCDSMILIYLLDTVGPFNVRASARMAAIRSAADTAAFSDLTRLECRVKPLRLGAMKTLADLDAFFTRPDVRLVPITTGCDRFLTNDARLSAFTDITVEVLP